MGHRSSTPSKRKQAPKAADPAAAVEVLRKYMTAMNAWERDCWEEYSRQRASQPAGLLAVAERCNDRVDVIFAAYCTPKRRVFGRHWVMGYPPSYDPDKEIILETVAESTRRVVIYTEEGTGFRLKCRYVILRKGDQWLVDNKKHLGPEGEWVRDIL